MTSNLKTEHFTVIILHYSKSFYKTRNCLLNLVHVLLTTVLVKSMGKYYHDNSVSYKAQHKKCIDAFMF